jgi:hypothetical protein
MEKLFSASTFRDDLIDEIGRLADDEAGLGQRTLARLLLTCFTL